MEITNYRVRCSYCGVKIMMPPCTQAIQCAVCQTIIQAHPNDYLSQTHNFISCVASRSANKLNETCSNIINTIANDYCGSTSGLRPYPQQVGPLRSMIPVSAHGRKRAVLCGVSYYDQKYRLNGTINDVKCMRFYLIQKVGFSSDSILVLTEEASDPSLIPTKNNIRRAMRWLVHGCQSGDSLVFHFSGHGSQQLDSDGDEVDGYDETLWPVDHHSEGLILDDEINATIVRPLPEGAKLHAIIDACHSGTVLDLPFVCKTNRNGHYIWEDGGHQSPFYKGTNGGLAVSFSACDDHQVSVDTTALSGGTATGAMTYSFIQAAQNEPGLTYGRLLNVMRQTIRDSKIPFSKNGSVTSLVKNVLKPTSVQEPQLSSSEKFEISTRQFVL